MFKLPLAIISFGTLLSSQIMSAENCMQKWEGTLDQKRAVQISAARDIIFSKYDDSDAALNTYSMFFPSDLTGKDISYHIELQKDVKSYNTTRSLLPMNYYNRPKDSAVKLTYFTINDLNTMEKWNLENDQATLTNKNQVKYKKNYIPRTIKYSELSAIIFPAIRVGNEIEYKDSTIFPNVDVYGQNFKFLSLNVSMLINLAPHGHEFQLSCALGLKSDLGIDLENKRFEITYNEVNECLKQAGFKTLACPQK